MTQISKSSAHINCNVCGWTCLMEWGKGRGGERNPGSSDREVTEIIPSHFPKCSAPTSINNDDPLTRTFDDHTK